MGATVVGIRKAWIFAVAALGLAVLAAPAEATPINGSAAISVLITSRSSGANNVNGVNGFNLAILFVGATDGDLTFFPAGTPVSNVNPFTFVPSTAIVGFLTFTFDPPGPTPPETAVFDLTSATVTGRNPTSSGGTVNVFATGVLHLTGFDDTIATFNFSATKSGSVWSSSGTLTASGQCVRVCTPVPEPLSISLFGAGLAGVAILKRRRRATLQS